MVVKKEIRKREKPRRQRVVEKKERVKRVFAFKLFGKWDSNVEVRDISMKPYINLEGQILPRSAGRLRKTFHKSKAHIVERLAQHLMVAGHQGKRHKLTSGVHGGKSYTLLKIVEDALDLIEKREKKNPLEVLVRGIENAALREEIISFQMGSIMAREAVITAPQRRVDKTLRFFAQGTYRKAFNKKTSMAQALADEIMNSAAGKDSFAVKEKERIEREASGAR